MSLTEDFLNFLSSSCAKKGGLHIEKSNLSSSHITPSNMDNGSFCSLMTPPLSKNESLKYRFLEIIFSSAHLIDYLFTSLAANFQPYLHALNNG